MSDSPADFDGDVDEPAPIPRRSAESAPSVASAPSAVSPPAGSADSAAEVREISSTPEGTPEPSGTWRKVTKAPAAATDPIPVQDAAIPDAPPPMPLFVKVIGLVAVGALLVLAAWFGLSLGGGTPTPSPSPSQAQTSAIEWELTPPVVLDDMVQGQVSTTQDPADADRNIVRADYSDGTSRIVLILSRPETDLPSFLLNAGVSGISPHRDAMCGESVDTGSPVCAQLKDRTGMMVVGLSEQTPDVLAAQIDAFYAEMAGG